MEQSEQLKKKFSPAFIYVLAAFSAVIFSFYFYTQSLIRVKAPVQEPGEKVIIAMPDGGRIFTYENYIFEEKGKLFFKGERNTIDFTGGIVIYENWK